MRVCYSNFYCLFLFYAPKFFFHAPVAKFLYFFVLFSGYKGTAFLSPPQ